VVCVFVNQMSPGALNEAQRDVGRVEVEPTNSNSGRILPRTLQVRMPGSGITAQFPSVHTSNCQRLGPDDTASTSERGSSEYAVQGHEIPLSQLYAGGVGTGKDHSVTIEMPLQDYQQFRLSRRNSLSNFERAQSSGTSVLPENSARRDDHDHTIDTHVASRQRENEPVESSATHGARRSGVAEAIKAAGVTSPTCGPPQLEHLTSPALSLAETEQPVTMGSRESGGHEKRGRMKNIVIATFDYDRGEVCEMSCR
jgi:hypothetical protein